MKVAVIQIQATDNKERNINRALALAQKAVSNKAQFILLPETFNHRGRPRPKGGYSSVSESIPGESSVPFMVLAKAHKIFILLGSLLEKTTGAKKVYNTSILINDKGKIAATYRKINLFDAVLGKKSLKESRFLLAGKTPKAAYIKNFAAGLSICYDLRFPSLYQAYAKSGVNILCVPSCFTKQTGKAHWEALLRARAIENLCYILAPNQIGKDARGVTCYGNSMIISPWGEVLARASGYKEEIIYATLEIEKLIEARKRLPSVIS